MSRLFRFFAFIGIVAIGLIYAIGVGHGQYFGKSKDWKDIYILPTNPNPQNNIKITLSAEKQPLKPGDELNLTFTADRECYLTLMDIGTSGKILRLWPNDYSGQDNRIDPNSPRSFPGPSDKFRYRIAGPDGTERLIAYATSEKGKILSEQEFQQLKNTGFKEYPGGAKDLAIQFQRRADNLGSNISWGTAQANVSIASASASPTRPDPRQGPPPDVPASSTLYMISLGAQTGKLKYTNRNAQRIAETLQTKLGIEKSNMRLMIDGDANYKGFVSGIQWLASVTRPEDTVIIYFAGHGGSCPDRPPKDEEDGKDEFFVLYPGAEQCTTAPDCLKKKIFLIDDELNVLVKKIPARKKLLIFQACHSGTMSKGIGGSDDMISEFQPTTDPDDNGRSNWGAGQKGIPPNYGNDHEAVLSACLDNEVSWQMAALKGSLFTHFLIDAIEKGSPDMEQAFLAAKENVIRYCQNVNAKKRPDEKPMIQTPCYTDPHGVTKELRFRN